jgi:hypothetical protein
LLQHVEVVGEQVRLGTGESAQLDRGAIGADQLVNDGEPDRIAQCRVPCRPTIAGQGGNHAVIMSLSSY